MTRFVTVGDISIRADHIVFVGVKPVRSVAFLHGALTGWQLVVKCEDGEMVTSTFYGQNAENEAISARSELLSAIEAAEGRS